MNKFLKRYSEIIGEECKKLVNVRLKTSIRINTLRIKEYDLIKRMKAEKAKLSKIDFADFGYFAESKFSMGSTPEYLQGCYYLQEAASQLPVQVLKPDKKEAVLDMAAAPGGKTTQIAQYMENKGVIFAVDREDFRLQALRNNLERMGIANCLVYKMDARNICDLNMKFDKILLDAPCSGNFIVDKKWFDKKTVEGFNEMAGLQKELLKSAAYALRKGGTIVYSTCSMEPEEGEEVIDWALKNLGIRIEKTDLKIGDEGTTKFEGKTYSPEVKKCVRIWPHKSGTQPFFIAKITI